MPEQGACGTTPSGTGCPDLGDFLVTPGLNVVEPLPFSHRDEQACPGYYKVSFKFFEKGGSTGGRPGRAWTAP